MILISHWRLIIVCCVQEQALKQKFLLWFKSGLNFYLCLGVLYTLAPSMPETVKNSLSLKRHKKSCETCTDVNLRAIRSIDLNSKTMEKIFLNSLWNLWLCVCLCVYVYLCGVCLFVYVSVCVCVCKHVRKGSFLIDLLFKLILIIFENHLCFCFFDSHFVS